MNEEVMKEEIIKKLDEMAALGEYWKSYIELGRIPNGIRAGMILLAAEITMLAENEVVKR